jgi:hypothetical protein
MKKNLNINFSKDDHSLNDFLYVWNECGERPNKVSLFHAFDLKPFENLIESYDNSNFLFNSEIFPSDSHHLENQKCFMMLSNGIYISYTLYDARSNDSFVGDVTVYFNYESRTTAKEFLEKLESLLDKKEDSEDDNDDTLFTLTIEPSGYDILPINYLEADYENLDLYFNNDVLKKVKKLSKKIETESKGISIIWGERGTGKSTLCCELLQNLEKRKIYIPSTLVDSVTNGVEFRNFLLKNKNVVLVIDDAENLSSDFYLKSNSFAKNLVQMVEGIDSDNFKVNIILIYNVDSIDDIDDNLLESNNILDVIEVDSLKIDKCKELSKFLKKNKHHKKEQKLINILKKNNQTKGKNKIGYE